MYIPKVLTTHAIVYSTCKHCDKRTETRVRVDYVNDKDGKVCDVIPEYLVGKHCVGCGRGLDVRAIERQAENVIKNADRPRTF